MEKIYKFNRNWNLLSEKIEISRPNFKRDVKKKYSSQLLLKFVIKN